MHNDDLEDFESAWIANTPQYDRLYIAPFKILCWLGVIALIACTNNLWVISISAALWIVSRFVPNNHQSKP
jgi:hypothetical protein